MSQGPSRLLDPAAVRATLRMAGLRARHSLSQNFLVDVDVLAAIAEAAAPAPGERILEIGPGLGILTGVLLEAGAAVTAVEIDRGLVSWLRARFEREIGQAAGDAAAPGSLRLVEGDVLDQDLETLVQAPFAVVANLPYHITSPVLHRLLELPAPPGRMILMVQREVAARIAAAPGAMSYLSAFVQYHARVRIALAVPRSAFEPQPEVDSAVIVVEPFGPGFPGRLDGDAEDGLWRLVQAAFRERRKMLHNVLVRQLRIEPARIGAALTAAGIDPDRRPQTVSVEEWLTLRAALAPELAGRRPDG